MSADVEMTIENEKGAMSLATTTSCRVDLFFKTVRGVTKDNLVKLLDAAWKEDALDTLKLIFYTRDCRGGKGERQIFRDALDWLIQNHVQVFLANLELIAEYGRWDDLLWHMGGIPAVSEAIAKLFAKQLEQDRMKMLDGKPVTLCAKWAPTENRKKDKSLGCCKKICKELGCDYKTYRKNYLSPLREYVKVVERLMCGKRWSEIDYSKCPSKAMNKLKKAFDKNDKERFNEWKNKLASGDKSVKVNAAQLDPHELVKQYMKGNAQVDIVVEEQWKALVEKTKAMGPLGEALVLSDVSGSMSGTPMEVSIAMGILISSLTAAPFTKQILTFETNAHFEQVKGDTLCEQVRNVMRLPWGGTTNFQAAFNCILSMAQQANLTAAEMPKRLYVISDMQFDQACEGNWATNLDIIKLKYNQAGYPVPEIVFWNVRANTNDFVAKHDTPNVAMIAGYSPSIMKSVLTGKTITPFDVMKQAIDCERYAKVKLVKE